MVGIGSYKQQFLWVLLERDAKIIVDGVLNFLGYG